MFLPVAQTQDAGLSKNNTCKYYNISKLAKNLGLKLCEAVVGFYAYTGSYKLMEKSDEAMTAFSQLGDTHQIGKEHLAAIEAFTCTIYGKPKLTSINAVTMALFNDHHSPQNKNKLFKKIKGIDASLLALC